MLNPGGKIAAAWLCDARMYLADLQGRIRLLNIESGEMDTVLDGRLYLPDLGNLCDLILGIRIAGGDNLDECLRPNRYRKNHSIVLRTLLSHADARILSYRIDGQGGLSHRQVIVDKPLSFRNDHAPTD